MNLEELERRYGVVFPSKRKFEQEAEVSAGIAVLLDKFEEFSLSLRDVIEILGENDKSFSQTVLNRMVELNFIKMNDGKYMLKR